LLTYVDNLASILQLSAKLNRAQPSPEIERSKSESRATLWSVRFRDPMALVPLASALLSQSDQSLVAFANLQLAWGYRFRGEAVPADAALLAAESWYRQQSDEAGLANCRDLHATQMCLCRRYHEALALLSENLVVSSSKRMPVERMITHDRSGYLYDLMGERDNSVRQRYAALEAAHETGDSAAVAFALGLLAGVQADLYNLDDADELCRRALDLISPQEAMHAWSMVALNHMNALVTMERGTEAADHAEKLLLLEPRFNQRAAEQRFIVYADAFTLTGDVNRAQALLDHSVSLRSQSQQSLMSFNSAQIRAWNALHQFGRARALADAYFAQPDNGSDPGQVPTELLRILQGAAAACEALGDFPAALSYQKRAFATHESLVGRSARARRLTLEIQHHLDRERWEREQAQRRQSDAEIEGRRLSELNDKLDAALQTRTRFLAAASHDLRQPAHALALYAAALEHETSRPALVDLSKRMRATVGSLSNMFDGLLELARLDAGAVQPQREVFDVQELLSRLCVEYADRLLRSSSILKFRRSRSDVFLQSDATLVERILRNLIGNAVKYAGNGHILIAIRKRADGVAIEVRDAGPGMSDAEQRRVFDEFYRAASANDRRDGLGLGLSIVERFSRLLGVAITLRSAPGRGSTFSLMVPGAMLGSRPAMAVDSGLRGVAAESLRIAVIDDDSDARESMALVLRQWGHVCITGVSAETLQVEAERTHFLPDALICDFQLNGRTALDDIAALRRSFGEALPVLVVSGSHDAQTAVEAQFEDVAFLSKPVRPLRLKSWISSLSSELD
jgi:signal transduction histidine kinase/CheY-like chemotaxis protein